MRLGTTTPTREEFAALQAAQPLVPVTRRLLADGETPVGVYRKLAGGRPGTFLLESAEQGRQWSRWSFVGVRAAGVLTEHEGRAVWVGEGLPTTSDDPLEAVAEAAELLRSPKPADLPPLTGGLVGYLGYEVVRRLERLPSTAPDELGMPELAMMLVTDLAVLDHGDGTVLLIANVLSGGSYDDAVARLDAMAGALAEPAPATVSTVDLAAEPEVRRRTAPAAYEEAVEVAREHIRAGDVFQVVLSQRFEVTTDVDALDLYRVLRASNPSPYMYLLRFAGLASPYDVVGSSPEALVTVAGDSAVVHPPAGTRPRGATPAADAAAAAELRADPKERAEHVMLVDLARNDLGRVCVPGTVDVSGFMRVERYSHVMHLVSTVFGRVLPGRTALDVLRATFPAGTVSGAPKPRALEIIEALEPHRRNLYAGTVGYLDAGGDLDMAIAIRTAVLHGGSAYVQAGAGIVADSSAPSEQAECENKAAAVLRAVAAAATLRPAGHRPQDAPRPPQAPAGQPGRPA
jgi:anthranilate synthase component 1